MGPLAAPFRILLAEDEETFREDMEAVLVRHGYEVKASGSYTWNYKVTQPARRFVVMEKA